MKHIEELPAFTGQQRAQFIESLPSVLGECIKLIESEFVGEDIQPNTAAVIRSLEGCRLRLGATPAASDPDDVIGLDFVSTDDKANRIYLRDHQSDEPITHYLAPVCELWKMHTIDGVVIDSGRLCLRQTLPDNKVCARYREYIKEKVM